MPFDRIGGRCHRSGVPRCIPFAGSALRSSVSRAPACASCGVRCHSTRREPHPMAPVRVESASIDRRLQRSRRPALRAATVSAIRFARVSGRFALRPPRSPRPFDRTSPATRRRGAPRLGAQRIGEVGGDRVELRPSGWRLTWTDAPGADPRIAAPGGSERQIGSPSPGVTVAAHRVLLDRAGEVVAIPLAPRIGAGRTAGRSRSLRAGAPLPWR